VAYKVEEVGLDIQTISSRESAVLQFSEV